MHRCVAPVISVADGGYWGGGLKCSADTRAKPRAVAAAAHTGAARAETLTPAVMLCCWPHGLGVLEVGGLEGVGPEA